MKRIVSIVIVLVIFDIPVFAYNLLGLSWEDTTANYVVYRDIDDSLCVYAGDEIRRASARWNEYSNFYYTCGGSLYPGRLHTNDGYNSVIAQPLREDWAHYLGVTHYRAQPDDSIHFAEFDIVINTRVIINGDTLLNDDAWSTTGDTNKFDVRSVALHEFGHGLGLDDVRDIRDAIMYYGFYLGEIRDLHQDDIDGERAIYGPEPDTGDTTTPPCTLNCNDCNGCSASYRRESNTKMAGILNRLYAAAMGKNPMDYIHILGWLRMIADKESFIRRYDKNRTLYQDYGRELYDIYQFNPRISDKSNALFDELAEDFTGDETPEDLPGKGKLIDSTLLAKMIELCEDVKAKTENQGLISSIDTLENHAHKYEGEHVGDLLLSFAEDPSSSTPEGQKEEILPLSNRFYCYSVFKKSTPEIRYYLPTAVHIEIILYDQMGRRVKVLAKRYQRRGEHRLVWNGRNSQGKKIAKGVYFYDFKIKGLVRKRNKLLLF